MFGLVEYGGVQFYKSLETFGIFITTQNSVVVDKVEMVLDQLELQLEALTVP